jgi:preprotein translocase subunit SecA
MQIFGMKEDDALEDKLVTRQIERAQRKVIYEQRNELLEAGDVGETAADIRNDVIGEVCRRFVPENSIDEQWDLPALERTLESDFTIKVELRKLAEGGAEVTADQIADQVREAADRHFREKEAQVGSEIMRALEKHVMLSVLDSQWKDHLASMDYLRQGIHLRGYAQKQPKQEFKREAFELFEQMLGRVKYEMTQMLARVRIRSEEEVAALEAEQQRRHERAPVEYQHAEANGFAAPEPESAALAAGVHAGLQAQTVAQVSRETPKVGRNDPCPCGSGKKYKQCHGRLG